MGPTGDQKGFLVLARELSESRLPVSSHKPPKMPTHSHTSCSTESLAAAEMASMIPIPASNPKMHRFFRICNPEVRIHVQKPMGANRALFASVRGKYYNYRGALNE